MREVHAFFAKIGAKSLVSDRMVFRWVTEVGELNCAVHVDYIVAAPSNEAVRAAFEAKLREHFGEERITGGQDTDYLLGMSVSRDWENQTLTLSQGGFVRQLLESFGLEEVKAGSRQAVGSPLPLGLKLGANEGRVVPATEFD